MNVRVLGIAASLLVATCAIACSSASRRSGFSTDTDPNEADGSTGAFGATTDGGLNSSCGINNTGGDPDKDYDGDGYPLKYDCNECDPNTNMGAQDVPGNGLDEDCSGVPDDDPVDCDQGIAASTSDPFDGAKAMGLCKKADPNGKDWGVIEAKWVKPDGSSLSGSQLDGVGVLTKLGVNAPQAGASMLALSSGMARDPSDPDYEDVSGHDKGYTSGVPAGYPKESPACPGVTTGIAHDGAALQVRVRVPSNAKSFTFQQNFFTYEYSTFVCSTYNDFYVAMMDPAPPGLPDGNIAFDQDGNPISVNNSLLQVCTPGTHKNKTFSCPLGTSGLSGTGFENHAATGWLTTTAPVEPGSEITLRFAIWDSGDGVLDSTVLIDDFKWSSEEGNGTETKPTDPK